MTTISPELVERMVKLVRDMAGLKATCNWINTAEKIAALLPAPVDPDIVLAREIASNAMDMAFDYNDGRRDDTPIVAGILAALKRGRELANDGWIVWRGGECPCPGERVEIIMRDGGTEIGDAVAFGWHHTPEAGEMQDWHIIAYRIVKRAEGGV